jgi:hypothetical protein
VPTFVVISPTKPSGNGIIDNIIIYANI